ncbi:M protein repeat protein [Ancylostoma duodenale]|uniref:M protein repeat protein n=1 Tax=Ancylostoma duodenale TaxID=51022 RepID=A0A0C2D9Q6_9BILA|nr:M protein repeat protein [Ancylostoma duodenale]
MQADKENLTNTPRVKEVKKRPSLQSPFSAASPNVRPAPRKIGDRQRLDGDRNLEETFAVTDQTQLTDSSESHKETKHVSAYCDANLEETTVESTFCELDDSQRTTTQNIAKDADGTAASMQSANSTLTSAELDDHGAVRITCDGNLEETSVETTFDEADISQGPLVNDTTRESNRFSSLAQSANSPLTEDKIEKDTHIPVGCDANLEETSVESTFCESDVSQITVTCNTAAEPQAMGTTFTLATEERGGRTPILSDANLEETANEFSLCDSTQTTLAGDETLTHDSSDDLAPWHHTASVILKETEPRTPKAAAQEAPGIRVFMDAKASPLTSGCEEAEALSLANELGELGVRLNRSSDIRITKDTHIPVGCDANLEETSVESTFCESDVSQITVTCNTAAEPQAMGTTCTLATEERDGRTPILSDANLEETANEFSLCDSTQTTLAGDETLTHDSSDGLAPWHQTASVILKEAEPRTPKAAAQEAPGIRVFMDAKASPLTSGCEEAEGLSLANELGELGVRLNRSSDIRITASVNVSVVEETEATSTDLSFSERSREKSAASASKIVSDGSVESAAPSLPLDATQYGEVTMDITACSVVAEADDTLGVFEKLERITSQREPGLDSTPQHVCGDTGKCPSAQENDVCTAEANSFMNLSEDTLAVINLLPPSASKPGSESERKEIVIPPESQLRTDSEEAPTRQNYRPRLPSNSRPSVSLSPIADLSRSDAGSRASTVRVPLDFVSDRSPTISQNRKYNLNDSEISFLMNENRIYDMALRDGGESPEEVDKLKKNIGQLEEDKRELHEKLRSVTDELEAYRTGAASKNSEIAKITKKLSDATKAKEHAERTVADYEYVVEDMKRRHVKQKEDLQAKSEMTFTAGGLATELNLVKEELLMAEGAKSETEKRCEALAKLIVCFVSALYLGQRFFGNCSIFWVSQVGERESERKIEEERANNRCRELEAKLKEMDNAMDELNSKAMDAEKAREDAIRSKAELESVQSELKEKLDLFKEEQAKVAEMCSKIATLEEQLEAEKLARDVTGREIEQLREENMKMNSSNVTMEALKEAKSTMTVAESRAEEAEKKLEEQKQRQKVVVTSSYNQLYGLYRSVQALQSRISELDLVAAGYLAEKAVLERQVANERAKVAQFKNEVDDLCELTTKLKEEMAKQVEALDELRTDLLEQKQMMERKVAEDVETSKKMAELEQEVGVLLEAKKSLTEEVQRGKDLCEEKLAEIEKVLLTAAAAEFKESLTALQLERDSLKGELATASEKLVENEIAEQEISSLKSKIAALTSERDDLERRVTAVEEEVTKKYSEDATKLEAALEQSKAELVAVTAQKALLEEEFNVKENEYKEKLAVSEKAEEAMSTMESEKFSLKNEVDILLVELKAANQQHEREITDANKTIDELRQQELRLKERIEAAEATAKEGISGDPSKEIAKLQRALEVKEAYVEDLSKECDKFDEIEAELKEEIAKLCKERDALKAQIDPSSVPVVQNLRAALTEGVKMLTPDHTGIENEGLAKEMNEKVEQLEREIANLKMEKEQLERIANYSTCNEVGELKRYLAIKDDHIEYLGRQCDEFDALEAKYLQEIADLTKERDHLKAQVDPSSVPVAPIVPVLTEALTQGVKMLSPDHPKKHQQDSLNASRNADEIRALKDRIAELEEQNSALRNQSKSRTSMAKPVVARTDRTFNVEEMEESADKDGAFQSAPSSPTFAVPSSSFESSAGPVYEESAIETAAVTPNRTLHTTLYKRMDKTTTLADTPESTKRENSRCAQQ